jgi:hypothetical protein
MASFRFIEIDGKRYLGRDLLQLRREQKKAHVHAQQPVLFELKEDTRPVTERTAAGRYLEPSLFST